MEEKEKRKEKNCWLLDPLKIPHSLHFLCLPAPSRWLFEFALALLSVINAVLTFWFEPVTRGGPLAKTFVSTILDLDIPLGPADLPLRMRIDLPCHWFLPGRVKFSSVRNSKFPDFTRDYISFLSIFRLDGENQSSLLLLLLLLFDDRRIIKIFNDLVYLKFTIW